MAYPFVDPFSAEGQQEILKRAGLQNSSSSLTDSQKSAITGIQLEDDFAAATIGKGIVLFIGGQGRFACRNIEGPFLTSVDDEGFVNHIVSPFMVAVPEATREISEINWNGVQSLTSDDGGTTWTPVGSVFDDVVVNTKPGSETQTPFASSVIRYSERAVPYRSHYCIELQVIPLTPFSNLIPLASAWVYQEATLTRREALSRILRFVRFDDTEFDVQVSGEDVFWVLPGDQKTVFDVLQDLQKSLGRNWNIVATSDKLRIFENSATETPVAITRDDVAADSIKFWIDSPETVPQQRTIGCVDTDGDNDFYTTPPARRQRYPIPLSASQDSQNLDLPIGMSRESARNIAEKSLLIDHFARDKCSFRLLPHMRGVQPGDLLAPDFGQTHPHWRVITMARNVDFTSDAICERIEYSLLTTGPSITSDSTITVDEEDGVSVVTVTSDQEGTFSIIGGDDAALFTIDPDTGVLEFVTPPDFESPSDADADNVYEVTVQVLAEGLTGSQSITVTVTDVPDGSGPPNSTYLLIL